MHTRKKDARENSRRKTCCGKFAAFLCLSLALLPALPAVAEDTSAEAKARTKAVFAEPDATGPVAVTLEDVRDTGILLHFVRTNVVAIYQEASREEIKPESTPDLVERVSIPFHTTGKLAAPRLQWLVFFVGTLEPVIRELKKEVGSADDALNPQIPAELKSVFLPLWKEWAAAVDKIDGHLDELVALFDDAANSNKKIQAVAVAMNDDINKLEDVRGRIYSAMQKAVKSNPSSKILVSPPSP